MSCPDGPGGNCTYFGFVFEASWTYEVRCASWLLWTCREGGRVLNRNPPFGFQMFFGKSLSLRVLTLSSTHLLLLEFAFFPSGGRGGLARALRGGRPNADLGCKDFLVRSLGEAWLPHS